jgi:hypothetical protein
LSKAFLATVSNADSALESGSGCTRFDTDLCLDGNYVIYANTDANDESSPELKVCNKIVFAGEALEFASTNNRCSSASREHIVADTDLHNRKHFRHEDHLSSALSYTFPRRQNDDDGGDDDDHHHHDRDNNDKRRRRHDDDFEHEDEDDKV